MLTKTRPVFVSMAESLPVLKLGDFGLGGVLVNSRAPTSYVGTPQYMAPVSPSTAYFFF